MRAARAVYRGYVSEGKRAGQVRRLHVIRDTPVREHSYRFQPPRACEQTWCGQSAGPHRQSRPVVLSPMPERPPAGLTWCPMCIGHLAEHFGLLTEVAASLYHRGRTLARLAAWLTLPPAASATPLLAATAGQLYEWRASLTVTGPTIAGYVSHIQGFYDWAVQAGRLERSPAAGLPVPPVPRRLPRPIAEADLATVLDHAAGRVRLWIVLACMCGLRAKEIAMLRGEQLRLRDDPPVILITAETTKGHRERTVPLHPFAVAEIRAAALPPSGICFRTADGRPLPPWMVSKLCNRLLHELGIGDTFHSLRHRFATCAHKAGHDLVSVKEMLGHERIETTSIYVAVSPEAAARIVAAIPVPRQSPERLAS